MNHVNYLFLMNENKCIKYKISNGISNLLELKELFVQRVAKWKCSRDGKLTIIDQHTTLLSQTGHVHNFFYVRQILL